MHIRKLDDSTIKIENTTYEQDIEIAYDYCYKVDNYNQLKKNPRLRNWDGKIWLYNKTAHTLDYGHWFEFYDRMTNRGYDVTFDADLLPKHKMSEEELEDLIVNQIRPVDGDIQLVPYDYQLKAIHHAIETDRSVILSATSSGKSLIIYCLSWLYQMMSDSDSPGQILIIVPDKGLVEQMYGDFETYSDGLSNAYTQKLNSDYSKFIDKKVVISTFQTAHKMKELVENASVVIVDEVHRAKAKQIKEILQNAVNAKFKHGLTGTLDGVEANETLIKGLFGPVVKFVTQRELIDSGRACDVQINIIGFRYSDELVEEYEKGFEVWKKEKPYSDRYQYEVDFINNCTKRNETLLQLIDFVEGNSFVLFDRVESHGIRLYESYLETHPNNAYLITGSVKDRKQVIDDFKQESGATLFATSSIMSTGISVKNLHNLFFASSKKAKIATIQSIGRLMRLHESKTVANVYDIVDIIGKNGIVQKHIDERIRHYESEGIRYNVSIIDI